MKEIHKKILMFANRYFEEDMMKKYLLGGASQNAAQWDGSRYIINHESLLRWLKEDGYETACFELRVMGE